MSDSPLQGLNTPPTGTTLLTECWIAWGHLRSRQHVNFLNVITVLSVIGVTIGVAVLNCVVAVMAGFEVEMIDKILGANAHIVVMRSGGGMIVDGEAMSDRIESDVDGVEAASPFVYFEVIARSEDRHTGVIIKGVDVDRTGEVTHLLDDLVLGLDGAVIDDTERWKTFERIDDVIPGPSADDAEGFPAIFVGQALLAKLEVGIGDRLQLMNPVGGGDGGFGMPVPKVKTFRIAGAFDSGMHEYDTRWTYISNQVAREFLDVGPRSTGIEITVDDIYDVDRISDAIDAQLGYPHVASDWQELNGRLFDALRQEKYIASMISTMVTVVASLLIVSTLIMVVLTRGKEIAVLKAMGASGSMVMRVFLLEAAFIGGLGVVLGTLIGVGTALGLKAYGFPLETEAFFLTTLPVVIQPSNIVVIATGAFGLCVSAAVLPAGLAARLDPVELLRYE